jgi:taurine dehydrogenase large subunit
VPFDPLTARHPGQGSAHPLSYWAATAGPAPTDDGALDDDRDAEVAIIGGGYTGLSCAYHLARYFGVKPVVLEANRPGWGCSGRNGSFARPALGRLSYRNWVERWGPEAARGLFAEAMAALDTVRTLIRDGGIDCDKQPDGWLKLAHKPNRVAALKKEQRLLRELFDYRAELLGPPEIAARHFKGDEAFAALRTPDSFTMHPLKLAYGVLGMARQVGARVHGASPVTGWAKDGDRHLLACPGGRVRAGTVVVATNGYGQERLHPSLRGRLLPVLSNIIVTRPMTLEEKAACNLVTTDAMSDTRYMLNYFRRLPDDRMMLGNRGPIREDTLSAEAHKQVLLASLVRKYPPLRDMTVDYFWGGWVAMTRDFMPHIHHAEEDASVHYALGYCGSGVSAALHAGRRLAERIGGGRPVLPVLDTPVPPIPLAALRRVGQRGLILWYRLQDEWR